MGVLGRHALLMVTLHLRMTLTQTTVDTISVIEASWVVIKFECIAILKKVSKDKNEAVKSQLLSQELSRCSQKPDFLKYFDDVSICGFFAIFDTLNIFKSFLYKLKQGGPFVV